MRNFVTLLFFSILGVSPISALDNPDNIHPPDQSECAVKKPFKQSLEQKKQKVEQVKEFAERYEALKQFYKDETISAIFEKAKKDSSAFVNSIKSEHFAGEEEPTWYDSYRSALESILKQDWKKAQSELVEAQIADTSRSFKGVPYDGPRLPDVLMMSAIVENATGQHDRCLAHLTELYEIHKKAPSLWDCNSEILNTKFR